MSNSCGVRRNHFENNRALQGARKKRDGGSLTSRINALYPTYDDRHGFPSVIVAFKNSLALTQAPAAAQFTFA